MEIKFEEKIYRFMMLQKKVIFYLGVLTVMNTSSKGSWKADYHKQSDFQFEVGKEAIAGFNLKGTERILDVGCGTGKTTNYCARMLTTGSVVGIDLSDNMISFAQKTYKNTPNLTFMRCSATEIPFENEFDLVYSMFCLHWVKDQESAIQKIAKSLKPGGRAFLYIAYESELLKKYEVCIAKIVKDHPEWKKYISNYLYIQPKNMWTEWCRKVGLNVPSDKIIEQKTTFATLNDFKNNLKVLAVVPDMNDKNRDEFLNLILSELYIVYKTNENEPFEHTTATLVLELVLN